MRYVEAFIVQIIIQFLWYLARFNIILQLYNIKDSIMIIQVTSHRKCLLLSSRLLMTAERDFNSVFLRPRETP